MIKIDTILTWIGQALRWVESWSGSYMVALLLFSLVVEIIFLPFDIKQQKNQIKQAKLRPKEMAIRNKYKGRDDQATRQKMQMEIQEFYQKENFNPMGGCLPLLIQLPIIMALYGIVINPLKYVVGFNGTQIEAIRDIIVEALDVKINTSQTIPFINHIKTLGLEAFSSVEGFAEKVTSLDSLPNFNVFGNFNLGLIPSEGGWSWLLIIPVLVFVFQFASTKLMRKFTYQAPSAQDANMGCSNTVMDVTMPLMPTYFAYVLPGAVGIYWVSKNILSFVKRFVLSKAMPMPVFTDEDYKAAEQELKNKSPKKKDNEGGNGYSASGKYVRSLHHIDDEDFEDTRERALAAKAAAEKAAEEEKKAAEEKAKSKKGMAAPVKEDKKDNEEDKKTEE